MNKPLRPSPAGKSPKKPTNISLPADLVAEAKRLGLNMSQICEESLSREVRKAAEAQWLVENREALEWSNEYVRKHGLPLEKYRMF